ncbi:uncharacterized protein LOC118436984 [Folsomia candida]|uniref:F-box domain-containing protein n=1 Tax=Folsomia candida TaxID=158441 RepID=A0A226DU43_FOLCA|nr:uncharacterized protein LOC118436984 [Folsomia candida]OXA48753.1 hypothetical protein Fcan01_16310 [Folsomia candida]
MDINERTILHLALSLPEIIGRVTGFLPNSDLLTCTRLNSVWEGAARKHLRARITITTEHLLRYLETILVRSNHHKRMEFCYNGGPEFVKFLQNAGKLDHLILTITLDKDLSCWDGIFSSLKLAGTSLTSLLLRPVCLKPYTPHPSSILRVLTREKNLTLPAITRLSMVPFPLRKYPALGNIYSRLAPLLPNVDTIRLQFCEQSELEFLLCARSAPAPAPAPFPKLTSLSVTHCFSERILIDAFETAVAPPWALTRLEFDVRNDKKIIGPILLRNYSAGLEYVHICKVRNLVLPEGRDPTVLHVPVMRNLKVFKVTRNRGTCEAGGGVKFQFETEDPADGGKKINYAKQFPVLQTIRIGCAGKVRETEADTWFESVAHFLYEVFAPGNGVVCETLEDLDVPLPLGEKFKLRGAKGTRCGIKQGVCDCWEWERSDVFLGRLTATFPNLRVPRLAERGRKLREDGVKAWVRRGMELGLLERRGIRDGMWVDLKDGGKEEIYRIFE